MYIHNYEKALDFIFGLIDYEKMTHNRSSQNFDLKRMYALMEQLGDPQNKFKSVHVAGTKGKGSVSAMIARVLQFSVGNVGLYTSPHLITPRERIVFNDEMISEQKLTEVANAVSSAVEHINSENQFGRITTFETLTCIAMYYFASQQAEYGVMEVGIGGRLDATNIIIPEVSVISTIALDHTDILGSTIAAIAGEKSGIIKKGVPVVSAAQLPEADEVIERFAAEKESVLYKVGRDVTYEVLDQNADTSVMRIKIHGLRDDYDVHLPLLGDYQAKNASLAVLALETLQESAVTKETIEEGLSTIKWRGRFQIVRKEPTVVLDGAHNVVSATELCKALKVFSNTKKRTMILGMSDDKDYKGFLDILGPFFDNIIVTRADNPRAKNPDVLFDYLKDKPVKTFSEPTVKESIVKALEISDFICITGSLFIVGEALDYFEKK